MVWEQRPINGDVGEDLYGRILSADGRALAGVFQVGESFSGGDVQEGASLAALAGGGFVVSYTHDNLDADAEGIAVRVFGRGTAGADRLGLDASDYLAGGGGDDRLSGDGRANVLDGGLGNDTLAGQGGNDRLNGRNGADVLAGGNGVGVLVGGRGPDVLTGGSGADDFVFSAAAETRPGALRDIIKDFARGQDDIVLSAIDANTDRGGNQAFRLDTGGGFVAGKIRQTRSGSDLRIELNTDGDTAAEMSIRLGNVSHSLGASDFLP